jgi:signal peptidase I
MTRLRRFGKFLERTLAITAVFLIAAHFLVEVEEVTTSSMAPLLLGSDRGEPDTVLVERFFTKGSAPARFCVVSFHDEEGVAVAKRVVGFPGETVEVHKDRTLWIDGKHVEVPAGVGEGKGYLPAGNLWDQHGYKVPAGQVYVLGDDTKDSLDSRFTGGLPIERIRGRVVLRILPLARFARLTG